MNLRTDLTNKIGDLGVTLIGGIIVSIVCPFMCIVSNLFLAIGLNFTSLIKGEIRLTFEHIASELILQTVIISDSTKFERNGISRFTWWKIPKLSLSYMVYLLPTVALLSIISYGKTSLILCRPLEAGFLLNNSFVPANNIEFDELYRQRQAYGESLETNGHRSNGQLVWNAYTFNRPLSNTHYQQYWNLSNLDNLIDQFNFVGYHDVCNYPETSDLDVFPYLFPDLFPVAGKGFYYMYPGYNERNSSGPNYKLN